MSEFEATFRDFELFIAFFIYQNFLIAGSYLCLVIATLKFSSSAHPSSFPFQFSTVSSNPWHSLWDYPHASSHSSS